MKKYLAFGFTLCISSLVIAQNRLTDSSATCIAYWKNKEKKVYVVNHIKEKQEGNAPLTRTSYTYEAHIAVMDSTGEGYTLQWQNRNYYSKDEPGVAELNALFENLKVLYKTDGTGTFLELVNWEEVRDFYLDLARLSLPKNDTADAIWEKTKALFQTRRAVEGTLIKDVQLFHTFFGSEYGTRKLTAETKLPNAFGGDPIPALQTVQITRLQKTSLTYTVRTTQVIDQKNAMAMIKDIMKHFGAPEPKTMQEAETLLSNFNISDDAEMELQVKTGWPVSLQSKRSARAMNVFQTEACQFTIKPESEAVRIHINN